MSRKRPLMAQSSSPGTGKRLPCERAADGVDPDGPLAPVKNHPKLQETLRRTFRDLERVSESALRRIEGLDAFRLEAVRWYRRYKEKIGNCYGEERLVVSAASSVAAANGNALNDSGHVVLYQLSTLSPGEMQLIEALHRTGRCTVIAGVLGDDAADAPVQSTVRTSGPEESCELGPAPGRPAGGHAHCQRS